MSYKIILMNKKGIFLSTLLLVIIIISVGAVCASDKSVDIGGISFNIPGDYDENPNLEIKDYVKTHGNTTLKENHKSFCDKDGKYLGITVEEYNPPVTLKDLKISGDEKTIGSVKGIFFYDGLNFFKFEKDNKIVTISYDEESIAQNVIN